MGGIPPFFLFDLGGKGGARYRTLAGGWSLPREGVFRSGRAKCLLLPSVQMSDNDDYTIYPPYTFQSLPRMMIDLIELFRTGMIIGILVSAPMGPIGMLCVQRTLSEGRWHGFVSGLGAALSDVIYAAITALSMGLVVNFVEAHQRPLQIRAILVRLHGRRVGRADRTLRHRYGRHPVVVCHFVHRIPSAPVVQHSQPQHPEPHRGRGDHRLSRRGAWVRIYVNPSGSSVHSFPCFSFIHSHLAPFLGLFFGHPVVSHVGVLSFSDY